MLDHIDLKFSDSPTLRIPVRNITIFVGPNNSGKSLVLREMERLFNEYPFPSNLRIIDDYSASPPSQEEVEALISQLEAVRPAGQSEKNVVMSRLDPNGGAQNSALRIETIRSNARSSENPHWWTHFIRRWGVLRLDGRSRFNLTNDQTGGDLLGEPQNVLAHLFKDDPARTKVRKLIKDAFGLHFVIDPTNLGTLRIKLSKNEPPTDELSLNAAARKFHSEATYIKDASDGVQAFTGIVTAVMSGDYHTILVDEPEAFLHPPLARKLGKNLASLAAERGGTLMASTHSSDFLMGCVEAAKDVKVVRLEYSDGKSRGKMVDPEQLEAMFRRPLMRSANVVSALFHDGVVVTESDNDRAFYSEIYSRLTEGDEAAPSILFVNAQNKQTAKDIIGPLRQFGVPAVAITDIDIVKDGGSVWSGWMNAAQIPQPLHQGYGQQRSALNALLSGTGKDMKTQGGTAILPAPDKAAADQLFDLLQEYGIFVVRGGELENWLERLEVPGKKTDWTVAMLERLGSDPNDSSYVKPDSDDVWAFMRAVVRWVKDPARKGTP